MSLTDSLSDDRMPGSGDVRELALYGRTEDAQRIRDALEEVGLRFQEGSRPVAVNTDVNSFRSPLVTVRPATFALPGTADDLMEALDKCGLDVEVGHDSSVGIPVNPHFDRSSKRHGLGKVSEGGRVIAGFSFSTDKRFSEYNYFVVTSRGEDGVPAR